MAGSGLPPLPNIPYCCLPQESGPCLSASVGDRPLRSPTHRRPGGPSPRLLSNGTHARPPPRRRFALQGMPPTGRMADCPAFPPAVRRRGVGCIRVAHPSATLTPPKGRLPSDLHVLGLPPAFILSQDQTLRCTIVFSFLSVLNLGFRLDVVLLVFLNLKVPFPDGAPAPPVLCWPQTFKELPFALRSPLVRPLSLGKRVQKYNLFPNWQAVFFIFLKLFYISLITKL